jgi:hypothetical protein
MGSGRAGCIVNSRQHHQRLGLGLKCSREEGTTGIAIGVAIDTAVGALFDSMGVVLGLALGIAVGPAINSRK